ncbi:MAG: hypothetical protein KGK33_14420 [Hyphomicrobiales bacterium]|nr:hypothetical protein [Hyphomicrobiales bacterium]
MLSPKTKLRAGAIGAAAIAGAMLAGCSDPGLYLDRRDTIALSAGDAIEANKAVQVVDPWPAYSGNTNIAFNGQRMQSAVERYRTNLVTPPVDPMLMQVANPTPPTAQTNSQSNTSSSTNPAGTASNSATSTITTTTGQ